MIMSIFARMKSLRLILFLFVTGAVSAMAQKRVVVADVETLLPVSGVNVQGGKYVVTTDSTGYFVAPDSCQTLLFSHVNYESRLVNIEELSADTVFIISKLLNLKEVVVFGKGKVDDRLDDLNKRLRIDRKEAQLLAADPSKPATIPLGLLSKLIPKKWRASYKKEQRRKHHEEVLNEY